jgi:hypothetical protein
MTAGRKEKHEPFLRELPEHAQKLRVHRNTAIGSLGSGILAEATGLNRSAISQTRTAFTISQLRKHERTAVAERNFELRCSSFSDGRLKARN